ISEFIQFKSIEVLLHLEARNHELFVTTADDIANTDDEEHKPRLVDMYYYLKEKLKAESKMFLDPDKVEMSGQNGKGKSKENHNERNPIDYIAEDLTCTITCEIVDCLYQLSCQHFISPKAFSSLEIIECPCCRTEIRRNEAYYLPQQTIYSNIQHYVSEISYQDAHNCNAENDVTAKIFVMHHDPEKQKRKDTITMEKDDSLFIWNSMWKTWKAPNIKKLLYRARFAYYTTDLEKAMNIYTQ